MVILLKDIYFIRNMNSQQIQLLSDSYDQWLHIKCLKPLTENPCQYCVFFYLYDGSEFLWSVSRLNQTIHRQPKCVRPASVMKLCNSIDWSQTRRCAERCFSPQSRRCRFRPLAEVWRASAGSAGFPSPGPQTGGDIWVLEDVQTVISMHLSFKFKQLYQN